MGKYFKYAVNILNSLYVFIIKNYRKIYRNQHQLTSTTSYDRYPEIFAKSSLQMPNGAKKILSFGCSTGDECRTLASKYFPTSHIYGTDINMRNLNIARKNTNYWNVSYFESNETNLKQKGPYDIIFCMSVLCRWEDSKDLENIRNIYEFSKWDQTIQFLSSLIVKNGLLILYNSNFGLEDSTVSDQFQPSSYNNFKDSGFVTKFDKFNNRRDCKHNTIIYIKK